MQKQKLETKSVAKAMYVADGHVVEAARALGVDRRRLHDFLKKHPDIVKALATFDPAADEREPFMAHIPIDGYPVNKTPLRRR